MSTDAAVKKQVEFYFSDVNIAKDTFLKTKMAESAEGFVPISVLLTFKRLASLVATAEDKVAAVAAALKDSDAVVVDDSCTALRRRHPIPESISTDAATLYAKPVPTTWSLEQLQEFFNQYGPVRAVWRRPVAGTKGADGEPLFKESVFVVFDSEQTVLKICAAPPKAPNTEEPMTVMTKQAYLESKSAAKPKGNTRDKEFVLRTPPMPTNASIQVKGCGKLEGFKAVKGLWSADLQAGIRYVSINDDGDVATVIFQDSATCDRMVADVKDKATTLNGTVPTLERLDEEADKAAAAAAEKEITERAAAKAAAGGGRGGGRGGRGGGRGRGRGRGGKRDRD